MTTRPTTSELLDGLAIDLVCDVDYPGDAIMLPDGAVLLSQGTIVRPGKFKLTIRGVVQSITRASLDMVGIDDLVIATNPGARS